MAGTSLSVLSKRHLEEIGYVVEKVEHYNSFSHKKNDLLGVGDLLALNGNDLLLVQVTSRDHLSHRKTKAEESDKLKLWLSAGGMFVLHGWDKYKNRWRLKELYIDK